MRVRSTRVRRARRSTLIGPLIAILAMVGAILVGGASSAAACSPQDCGKSLNCHTYPLAPNIYSASFYVSASAKSNCYNGPNDTHVDKQWLHGVIQQCKKIDHWPDACHDLGFDGAEDSGTAQKPPRYSHIKMRSECGAHGIKRYYRIRYTQSVQTSPGHVIRLNGHGPNSKQKVCGR